MDVGVSLNLDQIEQYPLAYRAIGLLPKHVQIKGLPAEFSGIAGLLEEKIGCLRTLDPGIGISIHAYKFNLCEKVERVRAVWTRLAVDTLRLAAALQVDFVSFHAGYGIGGTRIRHQAYRDALVPVLKALVDEADRAGVEVHLENLYPRPLHSEWCMLGDRASDFDVFFREIGHPGFKLCYDYGHGNIDEAGIDILRKHADRLGSVHAHDNDQQSDMHMAILEPEQATIDWRREFQFLDGIGFRGPFILECSLENQLRSMTRMADILSYGA